MRRRQSNEAQLLLFENNDLPVETTQKINRDLDHKLDLLDFAKARLEQKPNMTPEEYKKWIKFLINASLRSIE